jgi:release factor glutamine methyltransferase
MGTVADALAAARAGGVDRLDAQILLARAIGRARPWLVAHGDAAVAADARRRFDDEAARRASGEPLAYIVGEREFHGLALQVDPRVLVPRPETEALVDWALELLEPLAIAGGRPRVADLGTGSGAVALAIKHRQPAAQVVAVDAAPCALAVARANARRLGLDVRFAAGSWWEALDGERFDLVVSNPPYVAAGDPHLAGLRHEPQEALVAGTDGLAALRTIVAGAPAHLLPGGWLLVEHGATQADAVTVLLRAAGLLDTTTRSDLAGLPRCSAARRAS